MLKKRPIRQNTLIFSFRGLDNGVNYKAGLKKNEAEVHAAILREVVEEKTISPELLDLRLKALEARIKLFTVTSNLATMGLLFALLKFFS